MFPVNDKKTSLHNFFCILKIERKLVAVLDYHGQWIRQAVY